MKKRAVIISTFLSVSLLLTGCSWKEVASKFTGEDTGTTAGEASDYVAGDCVTVPEYKGIEVDCTVGEDEVEAEIQSFLGDNSTEKQIKKRKCKEGDSVNIDFVGKINGEAFDNGSAKGQTLTLGSSGYIPGFDDGIIGMKPGETKDINVTFPEDYGHDELNGKDAVFTITLNYISKTIVPELTDELVAEKTEQKTVEEYKNAIRDRLKSEKKESAGSTAYGKVEENAEVKTYPDSLIQVCKSQLDSYFRYSATQSGFSDFNTYLTQMQMDESTYQNYLLEAARQIAKTQLLTQAIAEKENISVSDQEVKDEIASEVSQSGQTEEQIRNSFTELYGDVITIEEYYRITLLSNKVIDFVGQNAAIKE